MKLCATLLATSSLLALAVLSADVWAGGGILFAPGQVHLAGSDCEGLALSDLDVDGQLDLLYLTQVGSAWGLQARRGQSGELWQDPATVFSPLMDLPRALVVADFDGDGLPGAAVAQPSNMQVEPQLFVWHDSDVASWPGLKSPPDIYPLGSMSTTAELAATDFDVDGDVDLLVVQGKQVISWKNTGGTFGAGASTIVSGNKAVALDLADLDGDGVPDMVDAGSGASHIVEVRLGLGTGSFAAASDALTADVWTWDSLRLADVDGDGAIDVVLGTQTGTLCALGDGAAGFLQPQTVSTTPGRRLVVDDLDVDGAPDILVAGLDSVRTLAGAGDGTFSDGAVVPLEAPLTQLLSGDVNGDGRRDAVVVTGPRGVLVLENLGDGSFPLRTDLPCPIAGIGSLTVPAAADVDADGDQDILVGNFTLVQLFTNAGGAWGAPGNLPAATGALARVLAADFDGVAGVDVLGIGTAKAVHTWRQLPGGGFASPVVSTLGSVPTDAQLADLDLDGDIDAVLAAGPPLKLLNNGAGVWVAPAALPWSAERLALADLDADGVPDLALRTGSEIRVCEGVGNGTFVERFVGSFSSLAGDLRAGHADDDGLLDLVSARFDGAALLPNQSGFQFGPALVVAGEPLTTYTDARLAELDGLPGNELLLLGATSGVDTGRNGALVAHKVGGVWQRQGRYSLPDVSEGADLADVESDGDPDIVAAGFVNGASLVSILPGRRSDPWKGLGAGLAGTHGAPELSGSGTLVPGSPIDLHVVKALPSAPVVLVVGLGAVNLPFKGGTLVPSPDVLFVGFATDASGSLHLPAITPSTLSSGFEFVLQAWIADADGPKGFAASNGLKASVP